MRNNFEIADIVNETDEDKTFLCRPFIKWVGGKTQLLPELIRRLPKKIKKYHEPFIGGGALFFSIRPSQAVISDINPELINLYEVVRDDVEGLLRDLKKHYYDEKYFYQVRNIDRTEEYLTWSPVKKASRFIFLNKTCYNGLYRVNSKGQFNSPFGKYSNPKIVDPQNLSACSTALRNTQIKLASFESIEEPMDPGDFVYFDPPYVPLSTTANFTSYSKQKFDLEMQYRLYELCKRLTKKKIKFMLSNSSAPFVIELYKDFNIERVSALRAINSNSAKRGAVDEMIITNY